MATPQANKLYYQKKRTRELYTHCEGCYKLLRYPSPRCEDGYKNPANIDLISKNLLCPKSPYYIRVNSPSHLKSIPTPPIFDKEELMNDIDKILKQELENERLINDEQFLSKITIPLDSSVSEQSQHSNQLDRQYLKHIENEQSQHLELLASKQSQKHLQDEDNIFNIVPSNKGDGEIH